MRLASVLRADGTGFVTSPVERVRLDFDGIAGDRHAGVTRGACARTPWHPRDTIIANTRHVSIVSLEELAEVAILLGVPNVDPALLGANLVFADAPKLSAIPLATRLMFPSGATVFVTEENAPCRHPARKLAEAHGRADLTRAFPRLAIGRRGLVGLIERPGEVVTGDAVRVVAASPRAVPPPVPVFA